jgi:hypothetical protein
MGVRDDSVSKAASTKDCGISIDAFHYGNISCLRSVYGRSISGILYMYPTGQSIFFLSIAMQFIAVTSYFDEAR